MKHDQSYASWSHYQRLKRLHIHCSKEGDYIQMLLHFDLIAVFLETDIIH
jgi:hypothetical protein